MAHFYGGIKGRAGEATRLGTAASGMRGFVNGWNSGVKVLAGTTTEGTDKFELYATSGSHATFGDRYLGMVTTDESGNVVFVSAYHD